jgi:Protein of unknown function (DUF3017)
VIADNLGAQRRAVIGDWLFGCYVVLGLLGLALIAFAPWRYGTGTLSLALLMASWSRIVLPEDRAGLLRVRNRLVDVVALTSLGAAAMVLTIVIKDLPVR